MFSGVSFVLNRFPGRLEQTVCTQTGARTDQTFSAKLKKNSSEPGRKGILPTLLRSDLLFDLRVLRPWQHPNVIAPSCVERVKSYKEPHFVGYHTTDLLLGMTNKPHNTDQIQFITVRPHQRISWHLAHRQVPPSKLSRPLSSVWDGQTGDVRTTWSRFFSRPRHETFYDGTYPVS